MARGNVDELTTALSTMLHGNRNDPTPTLPVAVRLATTCREDSATAIGDAVRELIEAFHARNDAGPSAIRMVIFTATADLRAAKPASAARAAGWTSAQYLCLAEMPTDDDLPHCIRALLIVDRGWTSPPLRPVYLNGTQSLRPDLAFD
ncbi:MAG: chorismate mutase [Gemmatimonadaceae bacterium]|nr:chorismate mutase [Gemmatimonadaceae bacterium]